MHKNEVFTKSEKICFVILTSESDFVLAFNIS